MAHLHGADSAAEEGVFRVRLSEQGVAGGSVHDWAGLSNAATARAPAISRGQRRRRCGRSAERVHIHSNRLFRQRQWRDKREWTNW